MVVMLFGIGFLSVLTATVAPRFVKTERSDETQPSSPRWRAWRQTWQA
jgi:hypothetical protein